MTFNFPAATGRAGKEPAIQALAIKARRGVDYDALDRFEKRDRCVIFHRNGIARYARRAFFLGHESSAYRHNYCRLRIRQASCDIAATSRRATIVARAEARM